MTWCLVMLRHKISWSNLALSRVHSTNRPWVDVECLDPASTQVAKCCSQLEVLGAWNWLLSLHLWISPLKPNWVSTGSVKTFKPYKIKWANSIFRRASMRTLWCKRIKATRDKICSMIISSEVWLLRQVENSKKLPKQVSLALNVICSTSLKTSLATTVNNLLNTEVTISQSCSKNSTWCACWMHSLATPDVNSTDCTVCKKVPNTSSNSLKITTSNNKTSSQSIKRKDAAMLSLKYWDSSAARFKLYHRAHPSSKL